MRYEVIDWTKFDLPEGGLQIDTPTRVRIYPEETYPTDVLVAMVMASCEMNFPQEERRKINLKDLSVKEVIDDILEYDQKDSRTSLQRFLGVPDKRIPTGVAATHFKYSPLYLHIEASKKVKGTYDMEADLFEIQVGSIEELFETAEEILDKLRKPKIVLFYRKAINIFGDNHYSKI